MPPEIGVAVVAAAVGFAVVAGAGGAVVAGAVVTGAAAVVVGGAALVAGVAAGDVAGVVEVGLQPVMMKAQMSTMTTGINIYFIIIPPGLYFDELLRIPNSVNHNQ